MTQPRPPDKWDRLIDEDERQGHQEQEPVVGRRGRALDRGVDSKIHLTAFEREAVEAAELDLCDGRQDEVRHEECVADRLLENPFA
eukprot:CAMPEP_0205941826 /NCGR_PEP_ID=MMETSP1325-20131115/55900_1 /ASSEMBLY_ACC=CAM_ASM_000708 /TAXON_ID=236786 /ORGANISM="Florenciella sp., Strain RCC1007" /LENGTH=85 /DNA_ID=CAMNT_0053312481 /DNA_START=15 /DNA_END=269 /DNA_ORIENTATION=-